MMVNVRYVNAPQNPNGKYGNLKLGDGSTIMVPVDMLGMFQPGNYEIGTKYQTWGQGTDQERQVVIATTGPGGQPGGLQHRGGYQGNQQGGGFQRPRQGFQPRVYQGGRTGGSQGYQGGGDKDPRQIFITGVVGRAMGSGKFAASEIAVLTQAAARSYDEYMVAKAAAPPAAAQQPQGENWGNQASQQPEPPQYDQGDPGPEPR